MVTRLLRGYPQNLREAEPTAQPVSSPDAFRDAADVPPFMRTPAAESVSVSLAAVLLRVASGAMPLSV